MGALLLAIDMLAQQGESMIVKRYGKRYSGGMFFNAIICLFAMIFFFITDKGGLCFPKELWGYGIFSCLMFATGFYTMHVALQLGSFVASKLLSSFSGVISIVYGIVFLKEPAKFTTYLAIVLVFVSVFLMQYQKPSKVEPTEKKGFSAKWLICILLTAISNGFIAVISRMQQIRFENAYDNEFMILSFAGACIALFLMGFTMERNKFRETFKYGLVYGAGAGLINGAKNLINLWIYLYIPISIATPLKTGLGFILSFIISILFYKEKFTKQQLLSVIIGIIAIILFKV